MTSEDYINKLTKKCPKCGALSRKEDGCNYVVCPKCRSPYWWHSGKPWAQHGDHFVCKEFVGTGKLELSDGSETISEEELNLKDPTYYPPPMNAEIRLECLRLQHYQKRYHAHRANKEFDLRDRDE
jgi:hypothetical protein